MLGVRGSLSSCYVRSIWTRLCGVCPSCRPRLALLLCKVRVDQGFFVTAFQVLVSDLFLKILLSNKHWLPHASSVEWLD